MTRLPSLNKLLKSKGIEGETAAEVRAFSQFLTRLASQPLPGSRHVIALDHWDYDYAMGGPTPPLRWEGDDS